MDTRQTAIAADGTADLNGAGTSLPVEGGERASLTRPHKPTHISQVVTFRLDDETYCVDIMAALEVILARRITRLPNVDECVLGLCNLRGSVVPVFDLRKRFGLPPRGADEHTRIVVARAGSRTIGLLVDSVGGVRRICPDQVEALPAPGRPGADCVQGIISDGQDMLILLNIEALIEAQAARPPAGARLAHSEAEA